MQLRSMLSAVTIVALFATCLALPMIDDALSDVALSDVQAEIQALPTVSKHMVRIAGSLSMPHRIRTIRPL